MKKIYNVIGSLISTNNFDYIILAISTVITSTFSFIYSVYARKYVTPLDYGVFTASNLLLLYLNYLQLGTLNTLNRDYTQLLGAKKNDEAKQLRDSTFVFILSIYLLGFFLISFFVLILFKGDVLNHYAFGYIANALISVFLAIDSFSTSIVRMEGKFNYSAGVGLIKTIIAIIFGVFFIKNFGYYGLYIMPLTSSLVSIILNFKIGIYCVKLKWNLEINLKSIRTGFPLLINSLVWTMMMSVDKFVILILMSIEELGIYSIALLSFNTMVLIPQTISQVYYFKISKIYGETESISSLIHSTLKYSRIVSVISAFASVVVYFVLPIFVESVMPQYREGIVSAQILVIGVSIYSTTILYGNIFTILKLNYQLIKNSIVLFALNVFFSVLFCIIFGKSIKNVAIGTSISYAIYSLKLMQIVSIKFNISLKKNIVSSWSPVILTLLPGIFFYYTIKSLFLSSILAVVFSGILLMVLYRNEIQIIIQGRSDLK